MSATILAASAPPVSTDLIDEALPILQAKYAEFKSLNYQPGDKLSDLIARSAGKISLDATASEATTPIPVSTEILPENIIYYRLSSFALPPGKGWPDLVASMKQPAVRGVILDLRSNTTPDDYAGASQLRSFFGPQYTIIAPRSDITLDNEPITQLCPYPTIVLTNAQTTGAAEALAGFLQADGAVVVGRPTAGKVGIFEQARMSTGQILRYAVTPSGPDDPANLFKFRAELPAWGYPVLPDISVTVTDRAEKAALILIKDNQVLDVIQESPERHRMSEASLVQGQDPEWDDYLASLEKHPVLLSLPVIHDTALITALDSLKAIQLSQRTLPTTATATAATPTSTSVQ